MLVPGYGSTELAEVWILWEIFFRYPASSIQYPASRLIHPMDQAKRIIDDDSE